MTILIYLAGLGLSNYIFFGNMFITDTSKVLAILILYILILTVFLPMGQMRRGR